MQCSNKHPRFAHQQVFMQCSSKQTHFSHQQVYVQCRVTRVHIDTGIVGPVTKKALLAVMYDQIPHEGANAIAGTPVLRCQNLGYCDFSSHDVDAIACMVFLSSITWC